MQIIKQGPRLASSHVTGPKCTRISITKHAAAQASYAGNNWGGAEIRGELKGDTERYGKCAFQTSWGHNKHEAIGSKTIDDAELQYLTADSSVVLTSNMADIQRPPVNPSILPTPTLPTHPITFLAHLLQLGTAHQPPLPQIRVAHCSLRQ